MSERDLAEAIHREIISPDSVARAVSLWQHRTIGSSDRADMTIMLTLISAAAINTVLARRLSEAARTGPWDGSMLAGTNPGDTPAGTGRVEARRDERERCARHIEGLAVAIRDHGPTTPEGLLTALAGAQVGALLDAAASLRTDPWEGGHHFQEEPDYPGSLLPPKRGAP